MPTTYNSYTVGSSDPEGPYTFTIPSVSLTDIKVRYNDTLYGQDHATYGFTLDADTTDGGTLTFDTALPEGAVFRIERYTDLSAGLPVEFNDGSILTEADLEKNFNSLLYRSQEVVDENHMGRTTDGLNWDAEDSLIRNVTSGTLDTDVVNVGQLNSTALYGALTVPQLWSFPTTTDGQTEFILSSPTPVGIAENLYFVSVGGVVQAPTDDFTLTETDGVYKCILDTEISEALEPVTVRNLGITRQFLEQPLEAGSISDNTLVLKRLGSQTGDAIQYIDESSNAMATLAEDGTLTLIPYGLSDGKYKIRLGKDVGAVGADAAPAAISIGYETDDGGSPVIAGANQGAAWLGISDGGLNTERGLLVLVAKEDAGDSQLGILLSKEDVAVFEVDWDGNVDAGSVTCTGLTAETGNIVATAGTILSDGQIRSDTRFVDGSADNGGFVGGSNTTNNGSVTLADDGVRLYYRDAESAQVSSGYLGVKSADPVDGITGPVEIEVYNANIDMNTTGRIRNLAEPESAQDAATKAYVDTEVAALTDTNYIKAFGTINGTMRGTDPGGWSSLPTLQSGGLNISGIVNSSCAGCGSGGSYPNWYTTFTFTEEVATDYMVIVTGYPEMSGTGPSYITAYQTVGFSVDNKLSTGFRLITKSAFTSGAATYPYTVQLQVCKA